MNGHNAQEPSSHPGVEREAIGISDFVGDRHRRLRLRRDGNPDQKTDRGDRPAPPS
jgi:hypothetical protein